MSKDINDIKNKMEDILEASIPIVKIWDGLLIAPIVGTLDTERTQRLMEKLLQKIVEKEARVTILDITGVPTVDSRTAQHLIDTISAVRLLGSEAIITGIKPPIAQTLVHIGVILRDITTARSLSQGVEIAMNTLGIEIVNKDQS
jgi:rsbT co-antagonist protein RsbR